MSIAKTAPSRNLMRAAISGLLASAAGACGDDSGDDGHEHPAPSNEELTALCKDMVDDAVDEAKKSQNLTMLCADMVKAAEDACEPEQPDLDEACAEMVADNVEAAKETADKEWGDKVAALEETCHALVTTVEEKTGVTETKEYTYEALTAQCDDRGGYVQVIAACSGSNACAGFAYGDWGPDAVLSEHSCAGANGCNGLNCVALPEDEGRTGEEIYELAYPDPGPGACINCHAGWPNGHDDPDTSLFKVWLQEGDTSRTIDNWLDRPAAEQERVVAFGAHSVLPGGVAYAGMAAYHRLLSRAEIERVVAHIRTLDPEIHYVKTKDP